MANGGLHPTSVGPRILQVVDQDGEFDESQVQSYMQDVGMEGAGPDYNVVSIMGPQSSGKSTLLNALFGTSFKEMDALSGRNQTTRGVWLAPAPRIPSPLTLVLDLEGSDGRERGEDDTSFERQTALFALAVSDIVVVNMWAKDVGREAGSGKPLLKTIFQVNLKLFQPAPGARRTVLLFVFRDRTRTPLDLLCSTWETDLRGIWESIAKPPQYESLAFSDFFDVQYAALANYEDRPDDFEAEVHALRERFSHQGASAQGSLLRAAPSKLPGAALGLSMSKVWEVIRANRDLNLPAHRVMVANLRCAELADGCVERFLADAAWVELAGSPEDTVLPGFGWRASDAVDEAIAAYNDEARYFDAEVSAAKRNALEREVLGHVQQVWLRQLEALRALALEGFRRRLAAPPGQDPLSPKVSGADAALDDAALPPEPWTARVARLEADALALFDSSLADLAVRAAGDAWAGLEADARDGLRAGIAAEAARARRAAVAEALAAAEERAAGGVAGAAGALFDAAPADLWDRGARLVDESRDAAAAELEAALEGYDVGPEEGLALMGQVEDAARARLMAAAREAANTALPRVRERFHERFSRDENGLPRSWTPGTDVAAAAAGARRAAARLLARLAVVRRLARPGKATSPRSEEERAAEEVVLAIEGLADEKRGGANGAAKGAFSNATTAVDVATASDWPGLDAKQSVLLAPAAVRAIWRQFSADSAIAVQQAVATREANRLASQRGPPLWSIAAMVMLGWNEAMAIIRNPLLLLILLLGFLFGKTIYNELDVEGEMSNGLLPGLLSLSGKFWPTVKRVAGRTVVSVRRFLAEEDAPAQAGEWAAPDPAQEAQMRAAAVASRHASATTLRARRPVMEPAQVEMTQQGGFAPAPEEEGAKYD